MVIRGQSRSLTRTLDQLECPGEARFLGAPGRNRTYDLRFRNPFLSVRRARWRPSRVSPSGLSRSVRTPSVLSSAETPGVVGTKVGTTSGARRRAADDQPPTIDASPATRRAGCTVGGHENLPTGGQKPFTVMNGRSGEFEVRLNCGSHEQPAAGGFAQVRRSGPARNAFRRQLADRNDLLDDWLVPRCSESRSGIPPPSAVINAATVRATSVGCRRCLLRWGRGGRLFGSGPPRRKHDL